MCVCIAYLYIIHKSVHKHTPTPTHSYPNLPYAHTLTAPRACSATHTHILSTHIYSHLCTLTHTHILSHREASIYFSLLTAHARRPPPSLPLLALFLPLEIPHLIIATTEVPPTLPAPIPLLPGSLTLQLDFMCAFSVPPEHFLFPCHSLLIHAGTRHRHLGLSAVPRSAGGSEATTVNTPGLVPILRVSCLAREGKSKLDGNKAR